MVRQVFSETTVPPDQAQSGITILGEAGIPALPLAMAEIGALESARWDAGLTALADDLTLRLANDRSLLPLVPPTSLLRLLRFQLERGDASRAARVASLFPMMAVRNGGVKLMVRLYRLLEQHQQLKIAGLELLRRYIRLIDVGVARRAIIQFEHELGTEVGAALEATYYFRRVMDGLDFVEYAEFLHTTARFLLDTTLAYTRRGQAPTQGALLNALKGLPGGLSDEDRVTIAREIVALGRAIVVLLEQHRTYSPRGREAEVHLNQLLAGEVDPRSGLDVLRLMGGYYARGKRLPTDLDRSLSHPLGDRSALMLRDDVQIANSLLRGLVHAFPPDQPVRMSATAARAEIESLWGSIELEQRRAIVRELANDLQRVADLVTHIAEQGDVRVLENTAAGRRMASGKQQPRNTLEFYRYVSGYFSSTAE
jgi:hypothetical protein